MTKRNPVENLARLSAPAQKVALVYGVAYPVSPGQNRIIRWLTDAGISPTRSTLGTDLKATIDELLRHGIIRQTGSGSGYVADPGVSMQLLRYAMQDDTLDRLLTVFVRDTLFYEWNTADQASEMFTRAAVLSRHWVYLRHCRRRIPWTVLLQPGFQDAVRDLPDEHAEAALQVCLDACQHHLQDASVFLDAVEGRDRLSADLMAALAWLRVLQGRFEQTLQWLQSRPTSQGARVVEAATRALVSFLRGDDAAAVASIQRTLLELRGSSRKKRLFPDFTVFSVALLALVRQHTPVTDALFFELVESADRLKCTNPGMTLVAAAFLHLKGRKDDQIPFYSQGSDVLVFFTGLRACWSHESGQSGARAVQQQLRALSDRAAGTYAWLHAEVAAILAFPQPDDTTPGHRRLGCLPLTRAMPIVQTWEVGLGALETLARSARARTTDTNAAPPAARIAWVIALDDAGDAVTITPREQQFQKNRWSKGRAISLQKLKSGQVDQSLLTARDDAVRAYIRSRPTWQRYDALVVDSAALTVLIGHPHVIDADGNALEVVSAEPALVIDEHIDGGLTAVLTPWPETDDDVQCRYRPGDHRVEVIQLTEGMRTLRGVIPEAGLQLPAYARGRLMDVVAALAGELRIHTSIEGMAASGLPVEPDAAPWVQLTPAGSGLNVRLLVEPIPASALHFDPGSGTELVFAQVGDSRLQTRRDLVAEHRLATGLIGQCPALTGIDGDNWRIELSTPDACLELLDQLRQHDARCLWPQGQNYRVVGRGAASGLNVVVRSSQEWFAASGELRVDEDRAISLAKLMMLLEENPKSRFIRVGDGEYVALSRTFRRQLDTLRSISSARGNTVRLNPLAAHAVEDLLADSHFEADGGWHAQLQKLADARTFEPQLPATLQAELRPYQADGVRWLARLAAWGVGACLADDMGLGKTLQTLALLLLRAADGPALVVAPTSLVDNWCSEARRFAPTLNFIIHAGTVAERQSLLAGLRPFDVVITTYGVLQNDIERFAAIEWNSLVIDEAQAIKNVATKRAQAVRALQGTFRMATTGTPIQNNLMDLYALFSFLNPGLLGSAEHFRSLHAVPIERDADADARARLARLIAPFILRRTKAEVLDDLPSRTEIVRTVTLSREEAEFYEALRRQALAALEGLDLTDGGPKQIQVLAHLTRLRLACCHPGLVVDTGIRDSAKHTEFMELLDELLQGRHKVLVFSQFVKHLKLIEARLVTAGIRYQYLDGQTAREERTRRVNAFQGGEGDVFLISLKAGGTGLNLTAADYVIHMDPWWNPAAEDQASDRAHRIGQTRPVTIFRLVAKGTIEEQIVDLHHRKRDLADRLLDGTDASARLDTEELLALLREPVDPDD